MPETKVVLLEQDDLMHRTPASPISTKVRITISMIVASGSVDSSTR